MPGFSFGSAFKSLSTLLLLGVSGYVFYTAYAHYSNPCSLPLSYKINTFDTRFGISKDYFKNAITEAEAKWETPAGVNLFQYDPEGVLDINLIYDERQSTTNKLENLNDVIGGTKEEYNVLKNNYDVLSTQYKNASALYEQAVANFNAQRDAYQDKVKYWNTHGGAPQGEFQSLAEQKQALLNEQKELDAQRLSLNTLADQTNSAGDKVNALAKKLNINIRQYNTIGQVLNKEFDQGLYESDQLGVRIGIYQFDDNATLIHVLTHELGHALELEHSEDPTSIMYYLHEGTNQHITPEDIATLKKVCKLP